MVTAPAPIIDRRELPDPARRHIENFISLMQSRTGYVSMETIFPYDKDNNLLGRLKASWTLRPDNTYLIRWEFRGVMLDRPVYLYGEEEL